MKDATADINTSDLPVKDSIKGKKRASKARVRKKRAAIEIPVKPILPDLYQLKFLYVLKRKYESTIRARIKKESAREKKLEF